MRISTNKNGMPAFAGMTQIFRLLKDKQKLPFWNQRRHFRTILSTNTVMPAKAGIPFGFGGHDTNFYDGTSLRFNSRVDKPKEFDNTFSKNPVMPAKAGIPFGFGGIAHEKQVLLRKEAAHA